MTDRLSRYRLQLELGLRMTAAAVLSFAAAQLLSVVQVYWAVVTAIVVTQTSLGGSLKAVIDRLVGTIGGAFWGVAVIVALPHRGVWMTLLALTVTLVPLALLVAFRPGYRVAPLTAAIVLLGRFGAGAPPVAVDRARRAAADGRAGGGGACRRRRAGRRRPPSGANRPHPRRDREGCGERRRGRARAAQLRHRRTRFRSAGARAAPAEP